MLFVLTTFGKANPVCVAGTCPLWSLRNFLVRESTVALRVARILFSLNLYHASFMVLLYDRQAMNVVGFMIVDLDGIANRFYEIEGAPGHPEPVSVTEAGELRIHFASRCNSFLFKRVGTVAAGFAEVEEVFVREDGEDVAGVFVLLYMLEFV